MTEAPLSYTIKVHDKDGFDEMFTVRGDDPADYFKRITALKKWLISNGYTPTAPRRSCSNGSAASQPQGDNGNGNAPAPACQYHGPMKPSKYGGYYCPSKMGDGSYCKEKSDPA
jgi:hypothetical protein